MQHCLVKHSAHLHLGKRSSEASKAWHNVDCSGTPGGNSWGSAITGEPLSQGWESIPMWRATSLCKCQQCDLPVIPLKLLYDADGWNSGVNLPVHVKMGTGAGLWTHKWLHTNIPHRRDPWTRPFIHFVLTGRSRPLPPSDQQLLTISCSSSSPLSVPALQRRGSFPAITAMSSQEVEAVLCPLLCTRTAAQGTGCNPGNITQEKQPVLQNTQTSTWESPPRTGPAFSRQN